MEKRRFHAFFGTSPFICAPLWAMLEPCANMPKGCAPETSSLGSDVLEDLRYGACSLQSSWRHEKTFRKRTWLFVKGIASLEGVVVSHLRPCLLIVATEHAYDLHRFLTKATASLIPSKLYFSVWQSFLPENCFFFLEKSNGWRIFPHLL